MAFQLLIKAMTSLQSPTRSPQVPSPKESYSSYSSIHETITKSKVQKFSSDSSKESHSLHSSMHENRDTSKVQTFSSEFPKVGTCILAQQSPQIPLLKTLRFPCKARGMPDDHNFHNAYFIVPEDMQHGEELMCSHPQCKLEGVKFRYCGQCAKPVAKRNFRKRHSHDGVPRAISFKDVPKGWIELYYNRPPDNEPKSMQKWMDNVLIESNKGKNKLKTTESIKENNDNCDPAFKTESGINEMNEGGDVSPLIKRARSNSYSDLRDDTESALTLPQFLPSSKAFSYSPIVKRSESSKFCPFILSDEKSNHLPNASRRTKPRLFVNTQNLINEEVNDAVITPNLLEQQECCNDYKCSSLTERNYMPDFLRSNNQSISFFDPVKPQRKKMAPKMITPRS